MELLVLDGVRVELLLVLKGIRVELLVLEEVRVELFSWSGRGWNWGVFVKPLKRKTKITRLILIKTETRAVMKGLCLLHDLSPNRYLASRRNEIIVYLPRLNDFSV